LTVVDVDGDRFRVALIPHTVEVTTFRYRQAGDPVNLEADVVAKYVERLVAAGAPSPYLPSSGQQGQGRARQGASGQETSGQEARA
ncbi:MAG: hypothetical protein ACRDNS_24315, partial [Trebonia sp.]